MQVLSGTVVNYLNLCLEAHLVFILRLLRSERLFKDAGFSQVNVEQPQIFFGQVSKDSDEEHLGDLVWTIHAQLK